MSGQDLLVVIVLAIAVTSTFLFAMSLWDELTERRATAAAHEQIRLAPLWGKDPVTGERFALYLFRYEASAQRFAQSVTGSTWPRYDVAGRCYGVRVPRASEELTRALAPIRAHVGG